jgi:hypothetical protein
MSEASEAELSERIKVLEARLDALIKDMATQTVRQFDVLANLQDRIKILEAFHH